VFAVSSGLPAGIQAPIITYGSVSTQFDVQRHHYKNCRPAKELVGPLDKTNGLHEQLGYRWNPVDGLTAQTINESVRMQKDVNRTWASG